MTQQPTTTTPEQASAPKSRRVQKVGRVVSDKMDKTRVIVVETLKKHRIYKRTYKQTKRFYVHDEQNISHMGDMIRIEESRPLSKLKRWRLIEIVKRGSGVEPLADDVPGSNTDEAESVASADSGTTAE